MKRLLTIVVILSLLTHSLVVADSGTSTSPVAAGTSPESYAESALQDLLFSARESTRGTARIIEFEMVTLAGTLRGRLETDAESPVETAELWLHESEDDRGIGRERVEMEFRNITTGVETTLRFFSTRGPLGEMFYRGETGDWELLYHTVADCDALKSSSIYVALQEAEEHFQRVAAAGGYAAMPESASVVAAHVIISGRLPDAVEGCERVRPRWINCQTRQPSYNACVTCCDAESGLATACFIVVGLCSLKFKWCKRGVGACGAVGSLESLLCRDRSCDGKPGDPECQNPPPCTEVGGVCYVGGFCGARNPDAICGKCDQPDTPCCGRD